MVLHSVFIGGMLQGKLQESGAPDNLIKFGSGVRSNSVLAFATGGSGGQIACWPSPPVGRGGRHMGMQAGPKSSSDRTQVAGSFRKRRPAHVSFS